MSDALGLGLLLLGASVAPSAFAADSPTQSAGKDWPMAGDYANGRYSELSQIDVSNVRNLGGAWFRELSSGTRTPPLISEGMLYISDATTIYGLNPKTGATIWEFKPQNGAPARGGLAIGEGLIFSGLSDSHIVALDQKTGRLVWTGYVGNVPAESSAQSHGLSFSEFTPVFSPRVGYISNAPTYVDGMVMSGLTGGDGGARGKISGLDAKTGKLIWDFYVIPTPGAPGAETGPQEGDALQRGGGAVWTQGAADAELGLIFYGTGNPVPQAGGETRAGDNLYTSSVVALDIKTGKLRWSFQLTHHDIWEMDAATPIVLYTARIGGRPRKALAAMRTDGYLFLLDRETGRPLYRVDERPVKQDIRLRTAPTQPYPAGADEFGPPCADRETIPLGFTSGCYFDPIYYDRQNVAMPILTARNAPMSYDPRTGYFYALGMVSSSFYRRFSNPYGLLVGHPPGSSEYGIYAAIDSRTNKIVWQQRSPWGLSGGSGALTTAGGLLFLSQGDGNVQASNAKTGERLWQFQTGFLGVPGPNSHAGGVPIATYELAHEQYVVAPMGKGLLAFTLGGRLSARSAPISPPSVFGFSGIVQQLPQNGTGEIAISALRSGIGDGENFLSNGQEHFIDEYTFVPARARIDAGMHFKWTNLGVERHTIVSSDGSWTTGAVLPGQSVSMSISKPGTYEYFCQDHPWSKGQLVVSAANERTTKDQPGSDEGAFTSEQAARGEASFQRACSAACHMPDLTAGERAPALAGDAFLRHWQGLSADDLFERIRSTMPQQQPHSLSDQVYIDITAFLLDANGLSPGGEELKSDAETLKRITLAGPK